MEKLVGIIRVHTSVLLLLFQAFSTASPWFCSTFFYSLDYLETFGDSEKKCANSERQYAGKQAVKTTTKRKKKPKRFLPLPPWQDSPLHDPYCSLLLWEWPRLMREKNLMNSSVFSPEDSAIISCFYRGRRLLCPVARQWRVRTNRAPPRQLIPPPWQIPCAGKLWLLLLVRIGMESLVVNQSNKRPDFFFLFYFYYFLLFLFYIFSSLGRVVRHLYCIALLQNKEKKIHPSHGWGWVGPTHGSASSCTAYIWSPLLPSLWKRRKKNLPPAAFDLQLREIDLHFFW